MRVMSTTIWLNVLQVKLLAASGQQAGFLVYTANGVTSMRPLLEDEGVFNLNAMTSFLHRLGYRVIPPSDNMKSTA